MGMVMCLHQAYLPKDIFACRAPMADFVDRRCLLSVDSVDGLLLLARLMGQYCFARGRPSSVVAICRRQ